jgi:putative membrane protein
LIGTAAIYALLWIGGVFSSAVWGKAPDSAAWAAPVFMYLAALLVLHTADWKNRVVLILVGGYGFAAEVLGESTGFPFGHYNYTSVLGFSLFDVPLALISAWILISAFVAGLLLMMGLPRRWWILAGPLMMVGVDMLLEPVATGPMNAWTWHSAGSYYGVPLTNFAGWFAISLPIFGLLAMLDYNSLRATVPAASVIAFFITLAIVHMLVGALLVYATTMVAALMIRRIVQRRMTEREPMLHPSAQAKRS